MDGYYWTHVVHNQDVNPESSVWKMFKWKQKCGTGHLDIKVCGEQLMYDWENEYK